MANIPNSTQTPNVIFNGLMKEMTDTDLRVVLCVVRATFGWIADPETGMRKEEDWISHWQLSKKTGRSGRALSTAIDRCIRKEWIEARDEDGAILDTKAKRRGQKIYYRIGKAIVLTTSENTSEVLVSSEKTSIEKVSIEESSRYKRNPSTKLTPDKNNLRDSWTKELLRKIEEAYGGTFTKSQIGRQARALGELKDAGYSPEDIWQGIERMRQDNWWKSKNPDFRNLADNTLKFLANKKEVDKYANLVNRD